MNEWVVLYQHRFGTDAYLVESTTKPTEEQIITALKLDFEPERDEFIEIHEPTKITL